MRSIAIGDSVCLSVCPLAHRKNYTSKLREIFVAVARFSSDDNATRHLLPVLWMTSRFRIIGYMCCTARLTAQGCHSAGGNAERDRPSSLHLGTHNKCTEIANFVSPYQLSTIHRCYSRARLIVSRTNTHTTRFLTLIDISIESTSCSHTRNNFCKAVTDGANNKMSSAYYNTTKEPVRLFCIADQCHRCILKKRLETRQIPV